MRRMGPPGKTPRPDSPPHRSGPPVAMEPQLGVVCGKDGGPCDGPPGKTPWCSTEIVVGEHLQHAGVRYNITKWLGTGCYAQVFRAEVAKSSKVVAIKIMPETSGEASLACKQEVCIAFHSASPRSTFPLRLST